jgi:antitoxin VapB
MKTVKLFVRGASQLVSLPKEFRFTGNEVYIKCIGNAVVLLPKSQNWESLIASLPKFSPDFMKERDQPEQQERGPVE